MKNIIFFFKSNCFYFEHLKTAISLISSALICFLFYIITLQLSVACWMHTFRLLIFPRIHTSPMSLKYNNWMLKHKIKITFVSIPNRLVDVDSTEKQKVSANEALSWPLITCYQKQGKKGHLQSHLFRN